jgi:predicted transcriptional regulator of viral defense system
MYRISELIKVDRKIFHTRDLAILWGISNKNTLYTTIKRYVQKGVLIPIYKGLYSTVPIHQLDPLEVGHAIIHRYTYLSTETVLAQAGVIYQTTYAYTFITSQSRKVSLGSWTYLFRKLKDDYLYNSTGILRQNGKFVATIERAVADMLYYNPKYHFDVPDKIDFNKVREIQIEVGYP